MKLFKIIPIIAAISCNAAIDIAEFLQDPPKTGEIMCRLTNPIGPPSYYLFRWQPDACFIRIGPVAEEVFGDGEFQHYEEGAGSYDGIVWYVGAGMGPKTQTLTKVETPELSGWTLTDTVIEIQGGRLLSLGLGIPFGLKPEIVEKDVLRWTCGPTNKPEMVVTGRLIRNEQGAVGSIEWTRSLLEKSGPYKIEGRATLEYGKNGETNSALLTVKHVVLRPPRENPNLDGFMYYRMAVNGDPLPKSRFEPRVPAGAKTVVIRGKTKWLETPTGLIPMPEIDPAILRRINRQQRMRENPAFYYFGAAIVLGCAVAFVVAQRRRMSGNEYKN